MSLGEKIIRKKGKIILGKPIVGQEEKVAMAKTLDSAWILNGPTVRSFEEAFRNRLGIPHAVAVSSATAGLQMALKVLGVGLGDEVLLPAFNFIAAGIAIAQNGAEPVFVDVQEDTFQIDPQKVVQAIGPKTKAIVALHYGGAPCDIEAIVSIARDKGIKIVEDAAHATGAFVKGRAIGTFSDATVFSFGPMKILTTAAGGMVTFRDASLEPKLRSLISYGMNKSMWDRKESKKPWQFSVSELGHNFRMTDVQAGMGLAQLDRLDTFLQQRREIAKRYAQGLSKIPGILLQSVLSDTAPVYLYYVIRVIEKDFGMHRDALALALMERGIQVSVHWDPPLYRQPLFAKSSKGVSFPTTDKLSTEVLTLPCYPGLSKESVEEVVSQIAAIREEK